MSEEPITQPELEELFFRGGRIEDFGLQLKPGLDAAKVRANIRWLMSSFAPKHKEKEATVGFAIQSWFEDSTPEPTRRRPAL